MRDVRFIINIILTEFSGSATIKGKALKMLVSIGAAVVPDDSMNCDERWRFSDVVMYAVKKDESTGFKMFDENFEALECRQMKVRIWWDFSLSKRLLLSAQTANNKGKKSVMPAINLHSHAKKLVLECFHNCLAVVNQAGPNKN